MIAISGEGEWNAVQEIKIQENMGNRLKGWHLSLGFFLFLRVSVAN